jgi:hypothetical protein
MTETLANALTVVGLAGAFLMAATAILVLALASKVVKETRKQTTTSSQPRTLRRTSQ